MKKEKRYQVNESWLNGEIIGAYDSLKEAEQVADKLAREERLSKEEYQKKIKDVGVVGYSIYDTEDDEDLGTFRVLNPDDVIFTKKVLKYNKYKHLIDKSFRNRDLLRIASSATVYNFDSFLDLFIDEYFGWGENIKYNEKKLLSSDFVVKEFELFLEKFEIIEENE